MKSLDSNLLCYLTPKAKEFFDVLVKQHNFDQDLAIAIIERLGKDIDVWDLPTEDDAA